MSETERAKSGPSIVDGKLRRVSVSQIRTFKDCEVKWAFDKIEHAPRKPPGKGVLIGLEGHSQLEHFEKTGQDVRSALVRGGDSMLDDVRHTFPFNGGAGLVEFPLTNPTLFTSGGIEFSGFGDYAAKLSDVLAIVIDHKLTKSIEKYPVTNLDLQDDEQAIVYGHWAARRFMTREVEFRLNRYQYEGRKVYVAPAVRFTEAEVAEKFHSLADFVDRRMAPKAGLAKAADLKPNTASCGKYGGCEYAAQCSYSPLNRWADQFLSKPPAADTAPKNEGSKMGLLNSLLGTAPNTSAAGAAPTGTPAIPREAAKNPTFLQSVKVSTCKVEGTYGIEGKPFKFKANMSGVGYFLAGDGSIKQIPEAGEVMDLCGDPVAEAVALGQKVTAAQAAGTSPKADILPPDAPASQPPQPQNTAAAASNAPAVNTAPVNTAPANTAPANTPPPANAPAANTTTPAEDKPRRGRPPGSSKKDDPFGGIVLLIDCASSKGATDLNPIVAEAAALMAEKSGCMDIRIAPRKMADGTDHPCAFGGWKAVIAGAMKEKAIDGLCSINSGELNDPVIEMLSGRASLVVRGGVR